MPMRKGCLVCGIILAFFGLVFLTLLPVLNWALYPKIERDVILKYLNLKPENEEIWDAWVEPSSEVPIYFDYNMWHLANPWEVMENGAPPSFVEVGPYSFSEVRRKDNIQTIAGETIKYGSYIAYYYDPGHTNEVGCKYNGNDCNYETDEITVLNLVMALLSNLLRTKEINAIPLLLDLLGLDLDIDLEFPIAIPESVINDITKYVSGAEECPDFAPCKDDLFINMTVQNVLYGENNQYHTLNATKQAFQDCTCSSADGVAHGCKTFDDPGLNDCLIPAIGPLDGVPCILPTCCYICDALQGAADKVPTSIPGLGAVLGNGTKGSWYAQNTGRYVSELFGQISEWNGMKELPSSWWPAVGQTPSATAAGDKGVCRVIAGTDGTQINPLFDTDLDQWMFVGELRRSIYVSPLGDYDFDGIDCQEFMASPEVFDILSPENFCYCPDALSGADSGEGCLVVNGDDTYDATGCSKWCRTGTLRVADAYGLPGVVMSSPHFLFGDEDIYDESAPAGAWTGMEPNEDLHRTVLIIEKKTGLAVEAAKRIQFNFAQLKDPAVGPLNLGFLEDDGYGTIIPAFWINENSKLTPDSTDELKGLLNMPANIVLGLTITFGFIGGLAMIAVGSFFIWRA